MILSPTEFGEKWTVQFLFILHPLTKCYVLFFIQKLKQVYEALLPFHPHNVV